MAYSALADTFNKKLTTAETTLTDIEAESKEINELVLAAKQGRWARVWEILGEPENPRKAYLINVIPEGRRWGILHQAVHWKAKENVVKLLKYKSCDKGIPTKTSTFQNGEVGIKNADFDSQLETFQAGNPSAQMKEFPIMSMTLAAYKQTFHPKIIPRGKPLFEVMKDIFNDIETSEERWREVKEKVCESIEGESDQAYREISKATSRSELYASIILAYTEETSSRLYTYLNTAMRRQKRHDYRPTSNDLALGPFILMYQILLLHWKGLNRESQFTYRRMKVTDTDLKKYKVGTKFMWVSFVSSSSVRANANVFPTCGPKGDKLVLFTIDNKKSSIWQPRNIEKYACYVENERTYPAGAHFMVSGVQLERGAMHIYLELISG